MTLLVISPVGWRRHRSAKEGGRVRTSWPYTSKNVPHPRPAGPFLPPGNCLVFQARNFPSVAINSAPLSPSPSPRRHPTNPGPPPTEPSRQDHRHPSRRRLLAYRQIPTTASDPTTFFGCAPPAIHPILRGAVPNFLPPLNRRPPPAALNSRHPQSARQ